MRACFFVYLVFALQDGYCKGWTNGVFRLGLASLVVSHVMRVLSALHWTVSFFLCLQLGLTKYWIVLFMEFIVQLHVFFDDPFDEIPAPSSGSALRFMFVVSLQLDFVCWMDATRRVFQSVAFSSRFNQLCNLKVEGIRPGGFEGWCTVLHPGQSYFLAMLVRTLQSGYYQRLRKKAFLDLVWHF
uniref:Uncharacterized protein n=1 Tax=Solanum lycopersicum TaxID=4081 RepID=A0A3Q7HAP0_SOLLC